MTVGPTQDTYEGLVWTAFPAGRTGATLHVSVLVAPRLSWDGDRVVKLSEFMDFRDGRWATLINENITFRVNLLKNSDLKSFTGAQVTRTSPNADPALLRIIFDSWNRPVAKWTDVDWSDVPIRSFPMAGLSDMIDDIQAKVPFGARPNRDDLFYKGAGLMVGWDLDRGDRDNVTQADTQSLAVDRYTPTPDVSTPSGKRRALGQLLDFMKPAQTGAQLDAQVQWPTIEFHMLYSMLGSHPNLLRKLGFIIDLDVDTSSVIQTDILGQGDLVVIPSGVPETYGRIVVVPSTPRTAVSLTNTTFELRPRTAAITGEGTVDLSGWRTVTSEVEIEALAHHGTANELMRGGSGNLSTYATPLQQGLPARSSAGIALVRPGAAQAMHEALQRMWTLQQSVSGANPERLYAEDLTIGYRLDVRKDGGQWRSLHRRHGTATPETGSLVSPVNLGDDESYVEHALAQSTGDDKRLSETMARWAGWSLALRRPGMGFGTGSTLEPDNDSLPAGLHASIDYTAPTTGALLPTLRFGSTYDLRLRTVDPCGRSRVPAANPSTLTVTYARHEPVPSPTSYLTGPTTRGELVDVLVVRSQGAGAGIPTGAPTSSRLLAPPRSSVWLAEQHGVLDAGTGKPDASLYAMLSARDSTELDPLAFTRGSGGVPYLVDPMALGLKLRGGPKPGANFDVATTQNYAGAWPSVDALELRLSAALANASTAAAGRFDIALAPGRVAHLRLSSTIRQSNLTSFDLWRRRGSNAQAANASGGLWWQLTPDRIITAVHAVLQPVSAPRFQVPGGWQVVRPAGETAARASGTVTADLPSTANVTFTGTLISGIDRGPGTSAPVIRQTTAGQIGSIDIVDPAPGGSEGPVSASVRVAMPDTRCRTLSITATATSRFSDYFRTSRRVAISNSYMAIDPSGPDLPVAPGSVRVTWSTPAGKQEAKEGVDFAVTTENGKIKRLADPLNHTYRIPARAVDLSWIPGPITLESTRTPVAKERTAAMILPSSARPAPLSIAAVVPAFTWSPSGRPTLLKQSVTSTRSGGTLRIYLDRPWWTSGLFEEFAVVLRGAGGGVGLIDDITSRWGRDPVLPSSAKPLPATHPGLNHFTNKDSVDTGVRASEASGITVDVARYAVGTGVVDGPVSGYDADRDLFWVDIDIDQGSAYRPFIRLALARYQANAAPALRLSPITILDVVQLEPDRVATVTVPPQILNRTTVPASVTLTGPAYSENAAGLGPGVAWLILERNADGDSTGQSVDWVEQSRVMMTASYAAGTGVGTWAGSLQVPVNRPANTLRLVVEQFEQWRTDVNPLAGPAPKHRPRAANSTGLRLVHQDILPL